jgi:hypothetical protein
VILALTYPVNPLYGNERTVCTLINVQIRNAKGGSSTNPAISPGGPAVRCQSRGRVAAGPGGPPGRIRAALPFVPRRMSRLLYLTASALDGRSTACSRTRDDRRFVPVFCCYHDRKQEQTHCRSARHPRRRGLRRRAGPLLDGTEPVPLLVTTPPADSPAGYSGARAAAASRRSASSAYSVVPSGSTSSVNMAVAE